MGQEGNAGGTRHYDYVLVVKEGGSTPTSLEEVRSWYENTLPFEVREQVAAGNAIVEVRAHTTREDSPEQGRMISEKRVTDAAEIIRQFLGPRANIQLFAYGAAAGRKDMAPVSVGDDKVLVRIIAP
jgi:hypothetical protein